MARVKTGRLGQRVLSALALGPVPIAAIWFGSPWLALVTAGAAAVMAWEWARLLHRPGSGASPALRVEAVGAASVPAASVPAASVPVGAALVTVVIAVVAAAALAPALLALGVALLGAAIAYWVARGAGTSEPGWAALSALWVALPCIAFLWLAGTAAGGRATLLWVLAAVWATDIGAYAFGSIFGGPRLAPRWSPRKTWAGLLGGVLCAALTGAMTAHIVGRASAWPLSLLSGGLAVVEQLGDLAESLAKRRFGVKDSSSLIPGHGGLLDRLDGLLAVLPTVALLTWVGGRNVLTWR